MRNIVLNINYFQIPSGYEFKTDPDTNFSFYVNMFTGVRWYSAEDEKGKTYFYEENGNESCWRLPNVSQSIQDTAASSSLSSKSGATRSPSKASVKKPLIGSTKRISEQLKEESSSGTETIFLPLCKHLFL